MSRSATPNHKASTLFTLTFMALTPLSAIAQQPTPPNPPTALPVYDIVSIHPHSVLDDNVSFNTRPGNFSASNTSLKGLISYAYGIRQDLISDLPHWADTARFDITAKASDFDPAAWKNLTREQREAILQPVLIDRFHLKAHTETRALSVFNLIVTKDGPKFKADPPPANKDADTPPTPSQQNRGSVMINNNNDMVATAVPMSTLAEALADQLQHTVIDKTGLTGDFDLKLKWTPDQLQNNGADNGIENPPPDLFTALKEQLGLKLDPAKGPVETLVVDHAEQPTPN